MPSLIRFFVSIGRKREFIPKKKDPRRIAEGPSVNTIFKYDQSLSLRQAMPGRTFPSRYSSDAPPPVEIWVTLSANPN